MLRAAGNASIAARIAVIDYRGLNEKRLSRRLPLRRICALALLRHPRDLVPDRFGMLLTLFENARIPLQSVTLLLQDLELPTRQFLVILGTIHVLLFRSGGGRVISNFCCTLTLRPSGLELLARARPLLQRLALRLLALRLLAVSTALERSLCRLPLLTLGLLPLWNSLLSGATLSAACGKALLGGALTLRTLSSFETLLQWIYALARTLSLPLLPGASLALPRRGEAPIHKLFFDD
jgi:hypothetical protein